MKQTAVTEKTTIQPWYLTLLRIILGFILIWKGIVFIRDTTLLQQLIERTGVGVFSSNSSTLAFIISYLSILCGLFIGAGLFTRTSSIVQIPVLIIAVIFVNARAIESTGFEFVISIITLFLLILFAIKGSGQFSADEFFRSYYKAGAETGHTDKMFRAEER